VKGAGPEFPWCGNASSKKEKTHVLRIEPRVDAQDVERPQPSEDAGPLPEFLKVENRTPLPPEQQERVDAAVSKKSDEYFVTQITACCQRGVENILTAGRLLIEAKTKLPAGTFQVMIKTKLPFSPRTAQMLMCIAEHPVISNANHGSHLPPSWRTLYELTKIPHKMLLAKIADGTIRADLERKDVAKLKGQRSERGNIVSKTLTANFKPEPDTTTFKALDWWRAADRAARQKFLENITLIGIFEAMPPKWRAEIERRVLRQRAQQNRRG
jgi:hypothetical protein